MQAIKRILNYLFNLQWTERVQHNCIFCNRANFASIVFEDDQIVVVDNIHLAGQIHWLIIPKLHVARDIENLNSTHLNLLRSMNDVKHRLLQERCPGVSSSAIHSGYHRGRRPFVGKIFYPDIVSVHHLHLHVIVRPKLLPLLFKYPPWLPLMWKSDDKVLREVEKLTLKEELIAEALIPLRAINDSRTFPLS